jgi:hypothetical protein
MLELPLKPLLHIAFVMPSPFFFVLSFVFIFLSVLWWAGLVALLQFLALALACAKLQMCHQMRWMSLNV